MRQLIKYLLIMLLVGFLSIGLLTAAYFNNILLPWNKAGAISTTLAWSGSYKLPDDSDIVRIEVSGGLFSRGLELEFTSSKNAIRQWIEQSSFRAVLSQSSVNGREEIYELHPAREGAQYARIRIN